MKKKLLLTIMAFVCILASIFVFSACGGGDRDGDEIVRDKTFKYRVLEDCCFVEDIIDSNAKDVVVPSEFKGKPVTWVTFDNKDSDVYKNIVSLTIPRTVTAFTLNKNDFPSLENITVEENNPIFTSVDGILYYNAESKDGGGLGISLIPQAIKGSVSLPVLNVDVTALSSEFSNCRNITEVIIPEGISQIYGPFSGCSSLKSITLGKDIEYYTGISSASNLEEILVDEDNALFSSVDGFLCDKEGTTLVCAPRGLNGKEFYIPESIIEIGEYVFSGFDGLTDIPIRSGVTKINNYAFSNCNGLTNITIPKGVTYIGSQAFGYCHNLTSVTIPKDVSVASNAFYDCYALTIYRQSQKYSWNAGCPVVWDCDRNDEDEDGYSYAVVDGIRYAFKHSLATVARQPISVSGDIVIPERLRHHNDTSVVAHVASKAFYPDTDTDWTYRGKITSVTLPDSVYSIGSYAFYKCAFLTSVTFGYIDETVSGLLTIGSKAFSDCKKLTDISYHNSIEVWNTLVEKGDNWNANTGDYTIKCVDGDIAK